MSTANYLAFSFGRSGYDRVLNDFAVELATDLKLEPIDIHWLDLSGGENAFAQKSSTIKGASLILTDIYHLGINALRESKLTYMVGNGVSYATNFLSDKKKQILFKQYFLEPFYLYSENIANPANQPQLFRVIGTYFNSERLTRGTFNFIESQVDFQRRGLLNAINDRVH